MYALACCYVLPVMHPNDVQESPMSGADARFFEESATYRLQEQFSQSSLDQD